MLRLARYLLLLFLCFGLGIGQTTSQNDLNATAKRIQEAALTSDVAYTDLGLLCDRFGARPSGSTELLQATAWFMERMKAYGLQNVHGEQVKVPHWVRGAELGELVQPRRVRLNVLGRGSVISTPPGGITAEVVVMNSLAEMNQLAGETLRDRIAFLNFRSFWPPEAIRVAAHKGAAACLVRPMARVSLGTLHTGFAVVNGPPVPAAVLAMEDADMLQRMASQGDKLVVHLELNVQNLPDVDVPNLIGEIPGRERPEEVVLVCGHLDSIDVGQGAQDDGVGCILSLEAARLIQQLQVRPRRTIRVVLFAMEEFDSRAGAAYRDLHQAELANHQAIVESDSGNGLIQQFSVELKSPVFSLDDKSAARALIWKHEPLLAPLGFGAFRFGFSGNPIDPVLKKGVIGIGAEHSLERYWESYHSPADTFDKISKEDLQRNAAVLATLVYALAEMPERLPNSVGK